MIDEPDDMEAVGYDDGLGEVLVNRGAVVSGQVHANDADLCLTFQTLQIGLQGILRAPQHDIIDLVSFEIAQGGCKPFTAREEVLIDAQNLRAAGRMPLAKLAAQMALKVALYGGGTDALAFSQPAAVDAVEVLAVDGLLEGLAGTLAPEDSGKPLTETVTTAQALGLAALQEDDDMPQTPVLMPDAANVSALVAQLTALAVRTADRPLMPRRNPHLSPYPLNPGNLVSGQT